MKTPFVKTRRWRPYKLSNVCVTRSRLCCCMYAINLQQCTRQLSTSFRLERLQVLQEWKQILKSAETCRPSRSHLGRRFFRAEFRRFSRAVPSYNKFHCSNQPLTKPFRLYRLGADRILDLQRISWSTRDNSVCPGSHDGTF